MQSANKSISQALSICARFTGLTVLLTVLLVASAFTSAISAEARKNIADKQPAAARTKTEAVQGEIIGPAFDCDGDGFNNDSRIDFDGDGVADDCISGREDIPEPPFQQSFSLTSDGFFAQLPNVGWSAQYQCADGLYNVTLRRPNADSIEYVADGLKLTSAVIYDDIDPNLNQPLVVRDPAEGLRYSFQQARDGEFYEYAIANYGGNIGLYVYQTGEQIVAAPCQPAAQPSSVGQSIGSSVG